MSGISCVSQSGKRAIIACNVYVTAGARQSHHPLLLALLQRAQQQSLPVKVATDGRNDIPMDINSHPTMTMTTNNNNSSSSRRRSHCSNNSKLSPYQIVVVHAYSDTIYNRSSYHLVGPAEEISNVVSDLAIDAVHGLHSKSITEDSLDTTTTTAISSSSSSLIDVTHPYIGLVDHISMMPLTGVVSEENHVLQQDAAGWAAHQVGMVLQETLQMDVAYYGMADVPDQRSLAHVRREQTNFFHSGGLETMLPNQYNKNHDNNTRRKGQGMATVGAPMEFVENYNIRLLSRCTRQQAQSLTRQLRERDGGLAGVEALTLPYTHGQWEVACNLLRPFGKDTDTATTIDDVQRAVNEWEENQMTKYGSGAWVDKGYRVGTTAKQCLDMWEKNSVSYEDRQIHDERVLQQFQKYLISS